MGGPSSINGPSRRCFRIDPSNRLESNSDYITGLLVAYFVIYVQFAESQPAFKTSDTYWPKSCFVSGFIKLL